MTSPDSVLIFDQEAKIASRIAALLGIDDSPGSIHKTSEGFQNALRRGRPSLAVIVLGSASPGIPASSNLGRSARDLGIPTLAVAESTPDSVRISSFDDWVSAEAIDRELAIRAARLVESRSVSTLPAIDPHFLALVVHDLRTPLNVIGLTIRAIGQSTPHPSAEFEEDLTFLQENARQIDRMLAQLADYCRLVEGESNAHSGQAFEFDPRRFLSDFIEDRQSRPGVETTPVRLELAEQSPAEVKLEQTRARLALQHAVANAVAAAGEGAVRVRSSGKADRWVIEIIVDRPPPPTVQSVDLRPGTFERLAGVAAERRGLDLAIAARVSELFGGSARLEIESGRRSTIILEWPLQANPR